MKWKKKRWMKECWDLWSVIVRVTGSDWRGYNTCYTCRRTFFWKELQAGHYLHNKLDFDSINVHPQCQQCNGYKHGSPREYAKYLVEQYGVNVLKELSLAGREPSYPLKYYQDLYEKLKKQYDELNIH